MADLLTPQTRKSAAPVRSRPTTAAGARRMRPSLAPAPASLYAPLALPIAGGRAREGSDELLIRPVPLDFTPLFDKMDRFLVHFKAAVSSTCSRAEAEREEHETCLSLTRDEVRAVAAEVAEAKQIQSTLWETIRAQRVADAEERDTIAQLRAVQASLSSKSDDLRVQLAAVTKQTGRKRTHLEMVRDTIHLQRSKTPWEHQRLQDLLGIDIQPTRHSSQLKIIFYLLSPDDFYQQSTCVIELGVKGKPYGVLSAHPPLPSCTVQALVEQVNQTRDPWSFIKALRHEFRHRAVASSKRRRGIHV